MRLNRRANSCPFELINSFNTLSALFNKRQKFLIGVVHLGPLPGSPRWQDDLEKVIAAAVADGILHYREAVSQRKPTLAVTEPGKPE